MKKWILLILPLLLLTGSLAADDTQKDLDAASSTIREMGKPYYKITHASRLTINNPALGSAPFTVYRLILSGTPLKALPRKDEDATIQQRLNIPEVADIILIPTTSEVFRLDKALSLFKPVNQSGLENLFYTQYGFQWRKLDSNLKRYTLYIGQNEHFYCFAAGNLSFLLRLQASLKLQDGFSPVEYLTEALSVNDLFNTTAATALHQLPFCGNDALPYLKREIDSAGDDGELLSHCFQVIVKIGTPEAYTLMNHYATDDQEPEVLTPLFDTILAAKLVKPDLIPCYSLMLHKQYGIEFACSAMDKNKRITELKAALHRIVEQPKDYSKFRFALMALETWSNPAAIPKHKEAQEQIMLLLLRGGDMPGTVAFQNVEESEAARENRLRQEDEVRLKPVIDYLLNAPEYHMTILVAFDLSLLDTGNMPKASHKYAYRVHEAGRKILQQMMANPVKRQKIEHYLRTLVSCTQNKKELKLFQELAQKLQISVPARTIY